MSSLLFLFLASTAQAEAPKPQVACKAVYRTLDYKNNTLEKSVDMPVTVALADQIKHQANLEGKTFLLTEELSSADLFGQIITSLDPAKGTTGRGASDSLGRFSVAEVNGISVYRLECSRIRN
jgi:hypothetical protein